MTPNAGISPVDTAYGHAHAGEQEPALRILLAVLERTEQENALGSELGDHAPRRPHDAALLLAELIAETQAPLAQKAALRLRDAFIDAGDLPQAVVAARRAADLSTAGAASLKPYLTPIAQAYAQGSARLGEQPRQPPSLPFSDFVVPSHFSKLNLQGLRDAAASRLTRYLDALPVPATAAPVPTLPLFSKLSPAALARLLAVLVPRDVPASGVMMRSGDDGQELYVVVRGMLEAFRSDAQHEQRLALLGPGALVGEMALVSDAPRAASVRALEPTRVLVASKAALEREASLERAISDELTRFCRDRMIANVLRHSFALRTLEPGERKALLWQFQTRAVAAGTALVVEGLPGPGLYLVAAGHVRVTRAEAGGETLVVAELGPGEVFGEISLVLRRPASATVTASSPAVVLFLPAEAFQGAVAKHPGLLQQLYTLAVEREDELLSIVAQEAQDLDELLL